MAVIGLVSGRGSPGTTTSALALALCWPLQPPGSAAGPQCVLVVEADPTGSSARPGYLAGQGDERLGLVSVLSDRGPALTEAITRNLLAIEDEPHRWLLLGLSSPRQVMAAARAWPGLARTLRQLSESGDTDIMIDFGRWTSRGHAQPLIDVVDLFVVVVNSDLPAVLGARHVIRALCDGEDVDGSRCSGEPPLRGVGCLVVGEGNPYSAGEVEGSLGVPVIATLASDPRAASCLSHGVARPRWFGKSALLRSAAKAAQALAGQAGLILPLLGDVHVAPPPTARWDADDSEPSELDDLDDDSSSGRGPAEAGGYGGAAWVVRGGDLDD